MFPPSQGLRLDIDAISQIFGSISIACWIVVFSPQIIENWRRGSAEGLSIVFIVVWLLGDFFNIFGAVLQGVLPTMIILAVYYTLADIVLILQCFWYKGFTLRDEVKALVEEVEDGDEAVGTSERSPLLRAEGRQQRTGNGHGEQQHQQARISDSDRRGSNNSLDLFRERYLSIDGTHLSPVTPLLDDTIHPQDSSNSVLPKSPATQQTSTLQTVLFNACTILLVCAAGVFGWYLSAVRNRGAPSPPSSPDPTADPTLHFNLLGQIFGYICAVLYLGSRIPQLLLNYRRKSTDGISMLFFLFACLGNLTYVLSIIVYQPVCRGGVGGLDSVGPGICRPGEAKSIYMRYIAVNFSWLLGSFGTLLLDAGVFVQYFLYRVDDESDVDEEEE